ncbi:MULTISPECIES: C-terminal binding protein [unclassified Haladaptatus]|uniref:C-terminal binding protein n=1 Tax=unclassified Haladaptatus TaxID=2622732 RepID=UPI0023E8138F|nr:MULTISPECIES: C-terminal binding protein [unclassified Haladaptatus]
MGTYTIVFTDHSFEDLSVERSVLGDDADFHVLSEEADVNALADLDEADRDLLANADAVVNLVAEVDAEIIAELSQCQVISRYGIGVDNIDLAAATERGIYVTNVPSYCVEEVSTHALALILALARRLKPYDESLASGGWKAERAPPITHRFSSQTVGVVGYGQLGRRVGEKAAALGATVLAADPYLEPGDLAEDDASLVEFDEVVAKADFLTVHTPLTPETRGLIDADVFSRMKSSAHVVNVARGGIVDEDALEAALSTGQIAGAGLDVFETEPPATGNPLRGHPQVIATPHQAWYSAEADRERREVVAKTVLTALRGSRPSNAVNDP